MKQKLQKFWKNQMNGEQRESNLERRVREGMRKKKGKVK